MPPGATVDDFVNRMTGVAWSNGRVRSIVLKKSAATLSVDFRSVDTKRLRFEP
jgi:hypothetical protein